MSNKVVIILIGICLLVAAVGLMILTVNPANEVGDTIYRLGLGVGQLLGLALLVRKSSIRQTVYWLILVLFLVVLLVGAIFRILHLPGAAEIMVTAQIVIAVTYGIRFYNRPDKNRMTILKFLWVTFFFGGEALIFTGFLPAQAVYVANILFWVMLIQFVSTEILGSSEAFQDGED